MQPPRVISKLKVEMIMKDIEKHEVIDASTVKFEDCYRSRNLDELPPEGSTGGHY